MVCRFIQISVMEYITVHSAELTIASTGFRIRQKRLEQALSIAQKVQNIQTANPNVHLVVTGDFNAYQFTDGYVDPVGIISGNFDPSESLLSGPDLVDPNLTNQGIESAGGRTIFVSIPGFGASARSYSNFFGNESTGNRICLRKRQCRCRSKLSLRRHNAAPFFRSRRLVLFIDATPPQITLWPNYYVLIPIPLYRPFYVPLIVRSVEDNGESLSQQSVYITKSNKRRS
jgi:hypothetical protein